MGSWLLPLCQRGTSLGSSPESWGKVLFSLGALARVKSPKGWGQGTLKEHPFPVGSISTLTETRGFPVGDLNTSLWSPLGVLGPSGTAPIGSLTFRDEKDWTQTLKRILQSTNPQPLAPPQCSNVKELVKPKG